MCGTNTPAGALVVCVKCRVVLWCSDEEGQETGVVLFDCGSVMVDFVSQSLSLN